MRFGNGDELDIGGIAMHGARRAGDFIAQSREVKSNWSHRAMLPPARK
jgi:hypothetical protein